VREVLTTLSHSFGKLYAREGRPSIPPEQLLSALLLQASYGVRSERLLMEQICFSEIGAKLEIGASALPTGLPKTVEEMFVVFRAHVGRPLACLVPEVALRNGHRLLQRVRRVVVT
jgi:Transposase domain (DUF772)